MLLFFSLHVLLFIFARTRVNYAPAIFSAHTLVNIVNLLLQFQECTCTSVCQQKLNWLGTHDSNVLEVIFGPQQRMVLLSLIQIETVHPVFHVRLYKPETATLQEIGKIQNRTPRKRTLPRIAREMRVPPPIHPLVGRHPQARNLKPKTPLARVRTLKTMWVPDKAGK